jgi:hypothetical protein
MRLPPLSDDHFVDGTMIDFWASMKSSARTTVAANRRIGRNSTRDFHGEKLTNKTPASTTDPDPRLFKKEGELTRLCHLGHVVMENRAAW